MLPLCGGLRSSVARKGNGADEPPAVPSPHNGTTTLPALHAKRGSPHNARPTSQVYVDKKLHGDARGANELGERIMAAPPPTQCVDEENPVFAMSAVDVEPRTLPTSPYPDHRSLTSPLPPAPNSILMGSQAHPPAEAASRNYRRISKAASPSLLSTADRQRIPSLRLERLHLPTLNVADVSVPAEANPYNPRHHTPHHTSSLHGGRSRGDTPHTGDPTEEGGGTGDVLATTASEAPGGMARRPSVCFVPFHNDDEEAAALTDAVLDATHSSGRHFAGGIPGMMVTPRSDTPHRRPGDAGPNRNGRASMLSSRCGSLRLDGLSSLPGPQDNLTRHSSETAAAEADIAGSCFVPLTFDSSLNPTRGSSCSNGSCGGVCGTSVSATSFPSPTSILLKSNNITSPSSSGTTMGNINHRPWNSSHHTGPRSGGWGSRRGLRDPPATTPERRHSSSSMAHFVDGDVLQQQQTQAQMQRQRCHHDCSDSSDDESIIESVVSTIERIQKRDGGLSGTRALLSAKERRRLRSPRHTYESNTTSSNSAKTVIKG
jgi:hypothetical protein